MSGWAEWIGAQADADDGHPPNWSGAITAERVRVESRREKGAWRELPAHNLSAVQTPEEWEESALDRNPDVWMYRDRTVRLLRRYMRFSIETGRLPSLVGREFFRAKLSFYRAVTFEDRVIFVRDVEKCLSRLEYWDQQLIARVILQEHSHAQTAYLLHCSRKTVHRRVQEVLDLLSEDFLKSRLLTELPTQKD
jgi:hypothetical protein